MRLRRVCRCLAWLLALLLCCGTAALADAGESAFAVEIADATGLAAMREDPRGSYRLTADIDMAGIDWEPFAFSGELDGGGYAILNLAVRTVGAEHCRTVDGNNKVYDSLAAGMFSTLTGAHVHDLGLLGVSVEIETEQDCFAGALAGWMENAVLENITVDSRVSLTQSATMTGVGGLVGYGSGEIRGCAVDTRLVFLDTNRGIACEEFAGGAVGCGHPSITDCTVHADIWATVHGYCHNGCLVGMHHVDITGAVYTQVTGNTVSGSIHFLEDVSSRRAYADGLIGEKLNPRATVKDNTVTAFETEEIRDREATVLPCYDDAYHGTAVAPACTAYGYTEYVCALCGDRYRADFTAPRHSPGAWTVETEATLTQEGVEVLTCALCGARLEERSIAPHTPGGWEIEIPATYTESGLRVIRCTDCGAILQQEEIALHVDGAWITAREADFEQEGLRQLICADCGAVLAQETLPRLTPVRELFLGEEAVALHYREALPMAVTVLPQGASDPGVIWSTSDPRVIRVTEEGVVTAAGRGTAELICASRDGMAESRVTVTVRYSWWQWVIVILLFGWIWY